jgi:hypothetical protein
MRVPTIDERFADFLQHPTHNRWLSLREQLISHADFAPHSHEWRQLEEAFAEGGYERVMTLGDPLAQRGCLSPRFHFLVGVAAEELGDPERADWHQQCARLCLTALLQSGAGSRKDPYLCTYPWDCYDILRVLGRQAQGQRLIQYEGRWFDVLATESGQDVWFDVTEILQAGLGPADDSALSAAVPLTRGAL